MTSTRMSENGDGDGDGTLRPSSRDISDAWSAVFSDPLVSLGRLKGAALSKEGLGAAGADGGVILRSVHWRFYHNLLPPPTSLDLFPPSLEIARANYIALRRRYLIAPDGRWAADCSGHDEYIPTTPSTSTSGSSPTPSLPHSSSPGPSSSGSWDPLSLSGSNPWKTWFTHVDLRSTIRQDVERTFPDQPYFQLPHVRRSLTTSLFLYAVTNPDVGYRQGMHELLACCFLAVDRDSLAQAEGSAGGETESEKAMRCTLDRRFTEHDAFELFCAIMKNAKAFYEWRAEEVAGPSRIRTPSAPQAPIIVRCNNLHTSLIKRIDPQLWEHLENEGVEAQIWAIRWIRLIFTRELPFAIAMRLWDGIFAEDPGLGILDFVCVAMLLLIRNELINADYPTLLTNLLHYPSPSLSYPFEPSLILAQALFLRNNTSPASGVEAVLQNHDLLGVKATPPEKEEEPLRRPLGTTGRGRGAPPPSIGRSRTPKGAGVGGLAQGLFERAQAAGLDKAFMSTVADLRKNLPDSVTAYSYLPNLPFSPLGSPGQRDPSGSFSTIPTNTSALPRTAFLSSPNNPTSTSSTFTPPFASDPSRPQLENRRSVDSQSSQKAIKDAEREVAELRLAMVGMGKAMHQWLDIVRPTLGGGETGDTAENESAWNGLKQVKETLLDAAGKEHEEIVREWAWHDGLETPSSRGSTPAPEIERETSHAAGPDASTFKSEPQSAHIEQQIDERTPTAPQFDVFPSHPSLPTLNDNSTKYTPASTTDAVKKTPIISLSQNGSIPPASFSRAPASAPIQGTFNQSRLTSNTSNIESRTATKEADPLAGLGVSMRKEGSKRGVDPLGVGFA